MLAIYVHGRQFKTLVAFLSASLARSLQLYFNEQEAASSKIETVVKGLSLSLAGPLFFDQPARSVRPLPNNAIKRLYGLRNPEQLRHPAALSACPANLTVESEVAIASDCNSDVRRFHHCLDPGCRPSVRGSSRLAPIHS